MIALMSRNWWAFVLRGIVAVALGILAFVQPQATLIAVIAVFAAYAIVDGVLAIAAGVAVEGGPRWMFIVGGVLGITIGLLTINRPDVTAIALVFFVAIWAIATGVAEAVAAYSFRAVLENEWLLAISGIVSVVFGLVLIASPGDGIFAVLGLFGFYAILTGIIYIAAGFRLRTVYETVKPVEQAFRPSSPSGQSPSGASGGQSPTATAGS
jgi:uncharacterized membrane protein HdeD (DUF308 family)